MADNAVAKLVNLMGNFQKLDRFDSGMVWHSKKGHRCFWVYVTIWTKVEQGEVVMLLIQQCNLQLFLVDSFKRTMAARDLNLSDIVIKMIGIVIDWKLHMLKKSWV